MISKSEVERNWLQSGFSPEWYPSYWNVLFEFDICSRPAEMTREARHQFLSSIGIGGSKKMIEPDTILVPHLAPFRPKARRRDRLKQLFFSNTCLLGRNFVFDSILPDFMSRLFNRVVNHLRLAQHIVVTHQDI